MRKAGFAALVLLSACAFSSEHAFFSAADASQPIVDGARYLWQAPGEDALQVTFQLRGEEYEITERSHEEPLAGVTFVAVPETPGDDYIVQWQQEQGSDVRIYAFMWPNGTGYRIYSSPSAFDAPDDGWKPTEAYCRAMAYGECRFTTREQLLAFYQNVVYPALAAGSVTSDDYLELTPFANAAPDRK